MGRRRRKVVSFLLMMSRLYCLVAGWFAVQWMENRLKSVLLENIVNPHVNAERQYLVTQFMLR
jgi:hypothetical protein